MNLTEPTTGQSKLSPIYEQIGIIKGLCEDLDDSLSKISQRLASILIPIETEKVSPEAKPEESPKSPLEKDLINIATSIANSNKYINELNQRLQI